MTRKVWGALLMILAGASVFLMAEFDCVKLLYATSINILLLVVTVLYHRQPEVSLEIAGVDHGRGFAVVADEVRNLARQAASSSFQIRQIATGLETPADDARQGIELLTDSSRRGMKTAETALQSMGELHR